MTVFVNVMGSAVFVSVTVFVADGSVFVAVMRVPVTAADGVRVTVPVTLDVEVAGKVGDAVKSAVDVVVGVAVNVRVDVGVRDGVSVGWLVCVTVAESASTRAVCTTIVGIEFGSKVGKTWGVATCVTAQASETVRVSAERKRVFFMSNVPLSPLL
jgi:hypothetical protein